MPKRIQKTWGWELVICNSEKYCGKLLLLENGKTSSLHYHNQKHETFHVLEGECFIEVNGKTWRGKPGLTLVIEPGVPHRFYREWENPEPQGFCKILEVSTFHSDEDVVRIKPSGNVPGSLRYERITKTVPAPHSEMGRTEDKVIRQGVANAPECVNQ